MSVGDDTLRSGSPTLARDPLVGQRVGDYRVEAVVGSGSMGIVYRAENEMIGKTVAIKVLKAEMAEDPEMVDRLVREARTVNAIHHPGIVDIFGFGKLPSGQPFVVMDLLVGEPLELWVRREAPSAFGKAFRILDELLSALGAAHEVGVVHRDLKPGNVFLETQREGGPKVKLLDFGLARQANRAQGSIRPTNPGTLLGTPAYMAPEQVMGHKVTPATDLYAVGGIAYHMLTGHLPHEAKSAVEVLSMKMLHEPVKLKQWRPEIDDEVERFVLTLLARDASARPQTATEVRQRFKALAQRLGRPHHTPAPKRGWQDARTEVVPQLTDAPARSPEPRTLLMPAPEPVSPDQSPTPIPTPDPTPAAPLGEEFQERTALVPRRAEVLIAERAAARGEMDLIEAPKLKWPLVLVGVLATIVLIGALVVLLQ